MIIGITGGIGGGKTTFSNVLREAGYQVYDSDLEAKRLQNENQNIRKQISALFGASAYKNDGLNRQLVANIVFKNPEILVQLNAIVHPAVEHDFLEWMKKYPNEKYYFIESAVLFESHFDSLVDKIIIVTASEDVRIERAMKRDSLSREQVILRIKNQMPEEQKKLLSDYVLNTDQNKDLKFDLDEIFKSLGNNS